jgi:hypothetical protein
MVPISLLNEQVHGGHVLTILGYRRTGGMISLLRGMRSGAINARLQARCLFFAPHRRFPTQLVRRVSRGPPGARIADFRSNIFAKFFI